jgi:hypothetical protein
MVSRAYLTGDIPVLGPIGIAVTGVSTSPMAAIGTDSLRHDILFFNPNAAMVLRILVVARASTRILPVADQGENDAGVPATIDAMRAS